jgi:site-specific recombinase XerD
VTPLLLAVEEFVSQPGYARSTPDTYSTSLRRMARSLGEDVPIGGLDNLKVATWFEETYGSLSPSTWNTERECLRSALRFWNDHYGSRLTLDLPARPSPGADNSWSIPLSDIEWMLRRTTGWGDLLRTKLLVAFLYETAARAHEVLALDVESLDTRERCALVVGRDHVLRGSGGTSVPHDSCPGT